MIALPTTFSGVTVDVFAKVVAGEITASPTSAPKVAEINLEPVSSNVDENPVIGGPSNIPIAASGNAAYARTAIQKSNQDVDHVCSIPQGVARAINMAGAMGGQIIQAIRNGIKAAMKALGVSPSSNGLTSYLKKLTQYIKDITKFVNDINKWINGLVVYVNAIKQLIAYILSLPEALIKYFQGCLKKAYAELRAGYLSVMSSVSTEAGGSSSDSVLKEAGNVIQATGDLIKSSAKLAAAPAMLAAQVLKPGTTATGNTQAQAAATEAVFNAAGFTTQAAAASKP